MNGAQPGRPRASGGGSAAQLRGGSAPGAVHKPHSRRAASRRAAAASRVVAASTPRRSAAMAVLTASARIARATAEVSRSISSEVRITDVGLGRSHARPDPHVEAEPRVCLLPSRREGRRCDRAAVGVPRASPNAETSNHSRE